MAPPVVLDATALLKANGYPDDPWLLENIPFFECPDQDLESTYYYRWWNYHDNIKWDAKFNGWIVCEGGGYGVTPCPLGHHLYEGRWIKKRIYLNDDCRYWFDLMNHPPISSDHNRSSPRAYANWFGDGCYARFLVDGDRAQVTSLLENLKTNFMGWEAEHLDVGKGLFRWIPDRDGMEASLAGFEDGEADNYSRDAVIFGGEGYRPSFNSYMVADARAVAAVAELAGDTDTAESYNKRADALKVHLQEYLWNPEQQFFLQRHGYDGRFVSGREEIGFFPWAFHLPDDTPEFAEAWKQLLDTQGFKATYGPTTLERRSPYFMRQFNHACLWNGPSWPYSTSLTLAALANLLNDYHQQIVTKDDYVALLKTFAATQHDPNGQPMVREDHHPDENKWLAEGANYNHSRYCDLIITGLVGLRPRGDDLLEVNPLAPVSWDYFCLDGVLYHGRNVTILYDRTGERYKKGAGLRILIDGSEVASAPDLRKVTVHFESRTPPPPVPPET